ncbi:MAG: 2-hydroxyacyl-CoA dehydratase [Planctomycetota bacterium]|jgi:predicted nucleotide-binding protein (sugar kinase/HSP70/actin superfamily)
MKIQSKKSRTVAIPWMGKDYIELLAQSLRNLGVKVLLPPPTTDKTIQLGVRNTAEMVCFPLKPTLGNFIEALDNGADTLLMFDSKGQCRLRHYWKIQEFTLRNMGYEFEMYNVNFSNILGLFRKLSGKTRLRVLQEIFRFYGQVKEIDKKKEQWSDDRPNIGIIGEIFTCCDERINYGIENKIEKLGAKPVNTVTLSSFIRSAFLKKMHWPKKKRHFDKQAEIYFNGDLGGHGKENISNLLEMVENNIGGVIHLLPMSCMPETSIEPFVNTICRDSNIPLLRIPIDENTAEANLETRLETFVELIKMRGEK